MGISVLGGNSGGTDWSKLTPIIYTFTTSGTINNNSSVNDITINGRGFVTDFKCTIDSIYHEVYIIVDDSEFRLNYNIARSISKNTDVSGTYLFSSPIRFNRSFVVTIKNKYIDSHHLIRNYQIVYHV